jgi:endosialidase-like protein
MPIDQTLRGLALEIDASADPSPEAQPLLEYRFIDLASTQTILARIKGVPVPTGGGTLAFETSAEAGPASSRMLINHQGNVGIGTENPLARLEVAGDVKFAGPLTIQGALTVSGIADIGGDLNVTGKLSAVRFAGDASGLSNVTPADGSVTNAKLALDSASLSRVTGGSMAISGEKIGVGNVTPISKLHVLSAASDILPPRLEASAAESFAAGWDFYHEATPKGYVGVPGSATGIAPGEMLLFGSSGTKLSLWAGANRSVTVDTNGNVGIGTTDPDRPLAIKSAFPSEELISFKDPSGATRWHINQNLGGSLRGLNFVESGVADGRLFLKAGGNVGIATVNPMRKLQIGDDVIGLGFDPGISPNAGVLRFGDNTGWKLHFGRSRERSGGPLNFGTTGLLMTIQDNGNVIVQGSVQARSFPTTSDANYKTNITPLTNVLGKLDRVRGITFSWNQLYESQNQCTEGTQVGVLAQEVEAVFPELVTTWDGRYKAVEYGRLSAVLLEAVKELKANVEALAQKMASLES